MTDRLPLHPSAALVACALLAAACTPVPVIERENSLALASGASHVTLQGPLGDVVLPGACLERPLNSVAGLSPRTPAGCTAHLLADRDLSRPADRISPRLPGPSRARPLGSAARTYFEPDRVARQREDESLPAVVIDPETGRVVGDPNGLATSVRLSGGLDIGGR